jgi:C-terminal processing protease CtpA/Prc
MIRVPELFVGAERYENLICTLIGKDAHAGVGLPFLRRHHVTFDFPDNALYLFGPKQVPDEHDMSGLHLLKVDGDVIVHSVDQGSPAQQAGIRAKDIIAEVDEATSAKRSMRELRQSLSGPDGAERVLVVRRGSEKIQVKFRLQRAI